jgi:hypothetical protein
MEIEVMWESLDQGAQLVVQAEMEDEVSQVMMELVAHLDHQALRV